MENQEKSSKKSLFGPILVILLVVVAFVAGTQWGKIQTLTQNAAGQVAGQQDQPSAAEPKEVAPTQEPQVVEVAAVTAEDHLRGNAEAEIVLVEYSDYECPFCTRFHQTMLQVMDEYDVAWIYRHFPLSFHPNAAMLAEASECVAELGGEEAFWNFSDKLYTEESDVNPTDLDPTIEAIGVEVEAFNQCMDSGKYADAVNDDFESGQAAGVQGTPGTIIIVKGEQKDLIPGALPFDQVQEILDKYVESSN